MLMSYRAIGRLIASPGCIVAVVAALAMVSVLTAAFPAATDAPSLWDPKRRPDKPDVRSLRQIRFLTEDD